MNDITEINETIKLYFRSMYESNAELVKQVFHPDAKITGYIKTKLSEMNVDEFANFVADQQPTPAEQNHSTFLDIVSVNIAGKTAMALVRDDYLNNTYLDTLSLIKINEDWVIYNKLYHIEK